MKYKGALYGAILGDLCGQPHEYPVTNTRPKDVLLHNPASTITDDTLMTLASANFLLGRFKSIEASYKTMGKKYMGAYYGKSFKEWLASSPGTQNNSYGNGCLMRISPFMYVQDPLPLIMEATLCSHFHKISIESVYKLYQLYQGNKMFGVANYKNKELFQVEADATVDNCIQLADVYERNHTTQSIIVEIVRRGGDTDTNGSIIGEYFNFKKKDLTNEDVAYVNSKLDDYLLEIVYSFNELINSKNDKN